MKKLVQKRNKTLKLRVKRALARRKNVKHFTPTVEQCQSWFRILNRGMFGRNLTEPTLVVRRMIYDWDYVLQTGIIENVEKERLINE